MSDKALKFIDTNVLLYVIGTDMKKRRPQSGCPVLYTEDLQHGQVIDNGLKIINPFIE